MTHEFILKMQALQISTDNAEFYHRFDWFFVFKMISDILMKEIQIATVPTTLFNDLNNKIGQILFELSIQ